MRVPASRGRRRGRLALATAAALWLACGAPGGREAAAQDAASTRTVVVTGSGVARARPDTAELSAGVVTQAESAQAALAANSRAMRAVAKALADAGIAEEDVQTQGLVVAPLRRPQPARGEPASGPDIVGYEVTNRVRVVVRQLDDLGSVLDASVKAGANRLDGVSFSLADPVAPLDEARRRAMADAQHRAVLYAEAAGATLGPVLRVEEESQPGFEPRYQRLSMAEADVVPTAPGSLDFRASVRVTWALEH